MERIKTGISKLDEILGGGLQRGHFLLIGARPGMGKTSLLRTIAKENENECLFVSYYGLFDELLASVNSVLHSCKDSIRFLVFDDIDKYDRSRDEVGHDLKLLARELDIPVFGSVELPEWVDMRKNKRPVIGDFQSIFGFEPDIEQDADVILGLYRQSYYDVSDARPENGTDAEIEVLKNRCGNRAVVKCSFDAENGVWKKE